MDHRIYFDNNATTPMDPEVLEKMLPFFIEKPGNASSRSHAFGWEASAAVEEGVRHLADLFKVGEDEIVLTSGATESINLALKGLADTWKGIKNHIITCETEHSAVLDTCEALEKMGWRLTYLKVDQQGHIDLQELKDNIDEHTLCVAIMWANNETGLIHPVREIGNICKKHQVFFMCDATQAVGKITTHPQDLGIDLMAFSAHKFYGPKGMGGLYVRKSKPRVKIHALIHGGGHQDNRRSGTLNVPGIVGMGTAAELALRQMKTDEVRLRELRDHLENRLLMEVSETKVNGDREDRLPHVSNVVFKYVDGEQLMVKINSVVAVSSGSACTSANPDPSHVLLHMGLSELDAKASIRFSLGRFNTLEEVNKAVDMVVEKVAELRAESPLWQMFQAGVDLEI
ncbi:cysteine desulfurase family protein [Membranihabitans marinus]|uniref:cysteine desulfurase family protein n=1 Tax=Membranihabitans marinus TaxID=1227546 RepID=UPI001F44180E|nr:cysteine desulfurase family protein [Membranihabitans marinus]